MSTPLDQDLCPICHKPIPEGATECAACRVIFKKWKIRARTETTTESTSVENVDQRQAKWISVLGSVFATALLGGILFYLIALVNKKYGYALFVFAPLSLGLFSTLLYSYRQMRSWKECYRVACYAISIGLLILIATAWEGIICIVMASPLIYCLGALGAALGYWFQSIKHRPKKGLLLSVVLINPFLGELETRCHFQPPISTVRTSVIVQAPPEEVWRAVTSPVNYPVPHQLLFRAGVNHPTQSELIHSKGSYFLKCTTAEGDVWAPVTDLQPNRELAFQFPSMPAPMKELNVRHVDAPHLYGYFKIREGRFSVKPLPNGSTELSGTTVYQYDIWPVGYWKVWTDFILDRMHKNVLLTIAHKTQKGSL